MAIHCLFSDLMGLIKAQSSKIISRKLVRMPKWVLGNTNLAFHCRRLKNADHSDVTIINIRFVFIQGLFLSIFIEVLREMVHQIT